MSDDRKRAVPPPLGDFYAVVERELNDAAEARRREEAERVYDGIAKALREGGSGVEFVEPDHRADGVRVCLFDDRRDRLYVFAKSVSDKRVVDILSALLTQRDGLCVDDRDWMYEIYRTTRPRVIVRSASSPFPFLEALERRIADSAAHTFSLLRPAMYDAILLRCCGVTVAGRHTGDADVMRHAISFRPYAFETKRFLQHLTDRFDDALASENLRVRRLDAKPAEVGSDLLDAMDQIRSVNDICEISTIGTLGLALPVCGPLWLANVRRKRRVETEVESIRSSVEVSMSIESVWSADDKKEPLYTL